MILQASRELWGDAAARDREKRIFFLCVEEPGKVKRGGSEEFRTTKEKETESQHEKVNVISVASHCAAIRDGSSSIMQHGFSV